jgi:N6-adenosine-specific RNA methylase IME4
MIPLPTTPGGFKCIYADPAWRFVTRSPKGRDRCPDGRSASAPSWREDEARHYETMALADIKALPVADVAAPNSVLLLWAVDPMIPHALEVGAAWGFQFKTVGLYWIKSCAKPQRTDTLEQRYPAGTGYWTRGNPEQCLLFTRGRISRRATATNVRKLIISRRRRHSQKPDEAIERVEQLCEGPYLELFSRVDREGWTSWGNQTDKFGLDAE